MSTDRPTYKADLLDEAKRLVCGDRNAQYGDPTQDFDRVAAMWTALFGRTFTNHEVAMAMACLKLSRLTHSPDKADSWADLAGYAACGYECTVEP